MKYTPGRNYGCTVAANMERLRAAGLHESIPCMAADKFLASGVVPAVKRGYRTRGQKRATGRPCRQYRGKPKSSRFFGVYRRKDRDTFRAEINRKDHSWKGGDFDTELEAHEAVQNELERFEEVAA